MDFGHADTKKYGGGHHSGSTIEGEVCFLFEELDNSRYSHLDKKDLHAKVKECQETGDQNLRRKVIESHMKLVLNRVMCYKDTGASLSELVSEGTIGLNRAVDKYVEERGDFTLYASIWIESYILNALRNSTLVRIPGHRSDQLSRARKFIDKYYTLHERFPTSDEIINTCKVPEAIVDILGIDYRGAISLDTTRKEGESFHDCISLDRVGEVENRLFNNMTKNRDVEKVHQIIQNLKNSGEISERDFDTFYRYYNPEGKKISYREIGEAYGISSERIRQGLEKVKIAVRTELGLFGN